MLRITAIAIFTMVGLGATAQNEADVLRLSSKYNLGTARFNGLGGAMGALGGDMSAIHINPAGVGIYRYGDLSFTPTVEINTIDAELSGALNSSNKSKLVINNIGFVLANETRNPSWKMFNFGVSYNRLNTFNDQLEINSTNPFDRSLTSDFAREGKGLLASELSEFSAGLAYEGFVIDPIDTTSTNTEYVGRNSGDIKQRQIAERDGNISETQLTFGSNYEDRVYLGLGIGFQSLSYNQEISTDETPLDENNTDLVNYRYRENLETEGLGVNLKIGAIIKLNKYFRLGGSVQTPTTFALTDSYRTELDSRLRNPTDDYDLQSSVSVFEYRLRTPWRFMASAAGIIGKKGLVSAQYEYSNISSGKLKESNRSGSDADFSFANQIVNENFIATHIFRAGGEYRFTPNWLIRGGFGYFSNANEGNDFTDANLNRLQYSGGLGYRAAAWSLDITYQYATSQEIYLTNSSANLATLTNKYSSLAFTLGIRL